MDIVTLIIASPLALCLLALGMNWLDRRQSDKLKTQRNRRIYRNLSDAHDEYLRTRY